MFRAKLRDSLCFAANFNGASGAIDWDSLSDDSSGKGAVLVAVQIIAEILIASALFLAAEDIYLKYSPQHTRTNLEYINAASALEEHRITHEALREMRGNNHAQRIELEAERQAFINKRIAAFVSLRARLNIF